MTKRELDREISEYEDGKLNRTNARDLASLYIVRDYLFPDADSLEPAAPILTRFSASGAETVPDYGDGELYRAVAGKDAASCWRVIAQLMDVLSAVYAPLYRKALQQLNDI